MLRWILITVLLALYAAIAHGQATPTPTPPKQPIVNGIVYGDLDMNNFRLLNWDYSNWPLGGGGGGGAGLPAQPGHNGQFLQTDGTNPLWATVSFASLSGKPTTLSGYGITDAVSLTNFTWANLGSKPTTLSGFGITDAQPLDSDLTSIAALTTTPFGRGILTQADAAAARLYIGAGTSNFDGTFAALTGKPTTLAGYGITDGQPLDADLTSLSGATGTNTIYYRSASSTWSPVTIGTNLSFTGGTLSATTSGGAGDVSSNVSTSVAGEVVVFADALGKTITRGTGTGIATLTAGVLGSTGVIPVTQGGTGLTAAATGDILYGSGTNAYSRLPANLTITNKYLRSVSGTAPSWIQIPFNDLTSTPTSLAGYGITNALVTTNNLSDVTNATTARSNLGLVIGGTSTPANVQAWDADLSQLAAIAVVAGSGTGINAAIPYRSAPDTWSTVTIGTGLSFSSGGVLSATGTGLGDVISDVTGSAGDEIALYNSTTGKHIHPASGSGLAKVASGVFSIATASTDYTKDTAQIGTNASNTWTNGVTNFIEGTALGPAGTYQDRILPATSFYGADGTVIKYFDAITTAVAGPAFKPAGGNTLKGIDATTWGANGYRPFAGAGYGGGSKSISFQKRGTDWEVYALGGESQAITKIVNPNNFAGILTFDASSLSAARTATIPDANVALPVPYAPVTTYPQEFLTNFGVGGNFSSSPVTSVNIVPGEYFVDDGDATVDNSSPPTVSTIKVRTALTATRSVTLPDANNYQSGQEIVMYDSTGNPNNQTVHVVPGYGNSISGGPSLDINDGVGKYFRRTFISDGTVTWTIPTITNVTSSALQIRQWQNVNLSSGTAAIACDPNYIEQHHVVNLTANATVTITGASNGMVGRVKFRQDGTGGRTITALPAGSKTPSNGLGLITLSSGTLAEDEFIWDYDGSNYNWYPAGLNFTGLPPPACSGNKESSTAGAATLSEGNTAARKSVATRFTATSSYTLCSVHLSLKKASTWTGTLDYRLNAYIYTDNGTAPPAALPLAQIGTGSAQVLVSTGLTGTEADVLFTGMNASIVNGTSYWIVLTGDTPPNNAIDFIQWGQIGTGGNGTAQNNGSTWSVGSGTAVAKFKIHF